MCRRFRPAKYPAYALRRGTILASLVAQPLVDEGTVNLLFDLEPIRVETSGSKSFIDLVCEEHQ
ncbi:hypothetical protein D9M69_725680 [compost metagenome]